MRKERLRLNEGGIYVTGTFQRDFPHPPSPRPNLTPQTVQERLHMPSWLTTLPSKITITAWVSLPAAVATENEPSLFRCVCEWLIWWSPWPYAHTDGKAVGADLRGGVLLVVSDTLKSDPRHSSLSVNPFCLCLYPHPTAISTSASRGYK